MEKNYQSVVVLGAQWGDEGKGKITDFIAQDADMVVRFAGGDNAGHVVQFNDERHKVTIVPSGIFNSRTINVIANGTVVNLLHLLKEIEILERSGISTKNLFISNRAHLIFDYHQQIDKFQEEGRSEKIGTTQKGIGPAYADKIGRFGLRLDDADSPQFEEKIRQNFAYYKQRYPQLEALNIETLIKANQEAINKLKPQIVDTGLLITKYLDDGKKIVFEGAQGILLDIDHGTYPFVTSSNTVGANAIIGCGVHYRKIKKIVGVTKAYNTRVGSGGLPSEMSEVTAKRLRELGNEFGSNTGRPRRLGWLDLVALNYAIRVGSVDELLVTLLDVLDTEKEIKVVIGYDDQGLPVNSLPAADNKLRQLKPIFKTFKGWEQDLSQVKTFTELPIEAQNYLQFISEFTKTPLLGFSVGPQRHQTILMKEVF